MTSFVLQQAIYTPPARGSSRNTIIDDEPQDWTLPTAQYKPHGDDFDDLYDITEDEAETEEIPFYISGSVQSSPVAVRKRKEYPSLVIPSPTAWPSIHNTQKNGQPHLFSQGMLSPPIVTPRAESLSRLAKRSSLHSYTSNAPSLDGSLTSEELSSSSCPPTPDVGRDEVDDDDREWNAPLQLHPQSLMTLERLTVSDDEDNTESQFFTLHNTEMQERGVPSLNLNTAFEIAMTPIDSSELSALSIPSPGGFFSTLAPQARNAWFPSPQEAPETTVAENFYGVPFGSRLQSETPPPLPSQQRYIEIVDDYDNLTEGPPTARQMPTRCDAGTPGLEALNSPNFTTELSEYNENYSRQIRESSAINIDRTASWLQAIGGEDEIETVVEARPQPQASLPATPSSARSVRFAPGGQISNIPEEEEVEERDSTFVLGFQHLQNNKNRSDAFIHRKTRTEKLRLDRKCLFTSHVNALEGKYNLCSPPQVITARSDSELAVVEEETSEKIAIATAVRQQSALEQITPVSWNVEATKFLNGGTLLTSPTGKMFGKGANGRLLDLGGVVSCDWAWQVAFEYPKSTVHTVFTADQPSSNSFSSPRNHQQSVVEHLWDLPFPSNHFDCVSARNVYSLLRADEYDRCLKECLRVLRPGGYIEFALLDSDLIRAGRLGAALSAEFSSGLRSRGYNPTPTKTWLRRLRNAGFGQVRRAWLILPMSQVSPTVEGSTADASHITGMVGSWAWERWMQKLQNEMGKDGKPWLESVAGVMEEGAKTGASWRYLSGWARKPL